MEAVPPFMVTGGDKRAITQPQRGKEGADHRYRYCRPSSLSTARQLTRCPKFKQHAENMMENPQGSKSPIISLFTSSRISTTYHIKAG
ncbi:uncharacterized [Tachysurus ichikawai]